MAKNSYNVLWTEYAQLDLINIVEYISHGSFDKAREAYLNIKKKIHNLEILPLKGRVVPELKNIGIEKYRELIVFPWRILYRLNQKTVYVLAVFDSRQDLRDLFLQRILF